MLDEVGSIIGLGVYTPKGILVGNVDNVVVDMRNRKMDGLFIQNTNPAVVENGMAVKIPYRWVRSVGDIVLLRVFPDRVSLDLL